MVTRGITAEELFEMSFPDKRVELVRGVLRVSEPPGFPHARLAASLGAAIHTFVRVRDLGVVLNESGFILERGPDTVRGPDLSFIRKDRIPEPPPPAFAEFAPDLAVEVRSPGDRRGKVSEKVADWLRAGTRLVWVVDPVRREARVYRADGSESLVAEHDALDGEDVLPGFRVSLADVL